MPAERWHFEKVGLGYRCWDEKIETEFRLARMKRSRGDLTGELSIRTNIKDVKTVNGVLHVARLNVLSSSSRSSLARMLEKRTPGQDMDWFDGLEHLCQGVILAEAAGEPIDEVGHKAPTPFNKSFMVEPLVLKGRAAMIFGPGGVGKSLIALTCGLSVSVGREIIPGISPAVHGNVLYLDWETTADVINDRIQSIAAGHGFKPSGMFYRRCVRPLHDDAEGLSQIVAEKKVVLVIVDSAAYAMGGQGEYGDANESVLRLHEGLRLIGATSLIVDHVNKTDQRAKPGTATPYGSAYKTNAVRISWEIRKAPSADGLAINLYHAKSNDTRQLDPFGIRLDWGENLIRFDRTEVIEGGGDEQDYRRLSTGERLLELHEDGEHWDIKALYQMLPDVLENTVTQNIKRLVDRGQLLKDQSGRTYKAGVSQAVQLRALPGSRGSGYDA